MPLTVCSPSFLLLDFVCIPMASTGDEWAGDVSIAIFPVKSGVLYRLSYRPMIGAG